MKVYACRVCGNRLYWENSVCINCGTALGYSRKEQDIVPVSAGVYRDDAGAEWFICSNLRLSGCTWLTEQPGTQCFACQLTRTRPADADLIGVTQFPVAERAKRQLVAELDTLGIPVIARVGPDGDPVQGVCFDMLSSVNENVVIGHAEGVITIDLAEANDVHRVTIKDQLGEAYRTMLGHLRHESGHYYQWLLVRTPEQLAGARALFGDERADYQAAISRHYTEGAPDDWARSFISTYATMHPFEDFAETWAHFLHISDTVDSAAHSGLIQRDAADEPSFRALVVRTWIPLALGLNLVNRSMGKDDLYPFVLPSPVLDKLEFVASLRDGGPTTA